MRSLADTRVLTGAGAAALITGIACWPRIAMWTARPGPVWFLVLLLLWVAFVLWSFVLGWHRQYAGLPPLALPRAPRLWAFATVWGLAECAWLCLMVDPSLRAIRPGEYPASWQGWLGGSLFTLALDPLFLCFAPFAFFIRLSRRQSTAAALTIMFGVFVQFLKLGSSPALPERWLVVALMTTPVLAGFVSVYLYLKGGTWLVWWVALLTQLRLLPALLH
jgi:hypothetical protein